nr:hypothetical protein BAR15_110053 [Bartonella sp. AR 15-3]
MSSNIMFFVGSFLKFSFKDCLTYRLFYLVCDYVILLSCNYLWCKICFC